MGLSYDLISEFVKITNDKKEGSKEGTVYATVVNSTGGKYVKIDGSDLLTPIDTTTGIEDGERVTVMIKDHKATVTGNITSPSVGKGTVNSLVGAVVDENLVGINADIENLIAKNAYLENVFAQNSVIIDSKIENLVAKDTYLENTYAENATIIDSKIENLEATDSRIENSVIENFQVIDGVVQDLKATNADIKVLNADFAQIKTLVNGNLTSDNILSFNLTSEKVTVDDAFIKDAMIDTISAGKINAGKINTNSVSIGSEDGGMLITGSTQQFMDKNGNVRIQIGKDASGDFTFILYGENGQGQIINQNGITASAIGDGLIVNNMVSDNAAISGGKLDISSVITEINSDNSTTIKSSKIYLNEQAQSLEVAFNSLKTKVDTIQEITIEGDLTAIVEQVQSNTSKIEANKNSISTLISEDTVIKKQVTDLQGTVAKNEETLSAKYTSLSQNLDGFKTTVADTYATKSSVTDVVDNIEANYATTSVMNSAIEQKAQEISASVSSTYATKNQVNTLDNTLRQDYSTTQQMESAINVAKEEINLGVSTTYETKTNVETKVSSTLDSAKSYADTKKTEAISTASSDATTKVNAAKTELNTAIGKKANSADVYKKSEVYTKTQTDSQINVAKEAINLSVSNTYETKENTTTKIQNAVNNIQVGGTNLWVLLDLKSGYESSGNIASSSIQHKTRQTIIPTNGSKHLVYQCWNPNKVPNTSNTNRVAFFDSNKAYISSTQVLTLNGQTYQWQIINIPENTAYVRLGAICGSADKYDTTIKIKFEFGNKPTDYSLAPEDVTNDISTAKTEAIASANDTLTMTISNYYTKSQTDSQINVAKEAINLGVSTTYETKENVQTKVTSTLNSAKSYADTKKTEAISTAATDATSKANTAKQEAIASANSTLTSTIANYYTKSQTDSQINVAKEEIDLSVSTNYETKANVESKVSTTLDSSKSYADTKKSEAISTAASDATSKANKAKDDAIKSANNTLTSTIANYYTKTQTDSQINIAKNAINLSVSETYETKTNVTSKVDSTLKSAKSYADTKKSEAISTAASDATSKANKAKTDAISTAASDATSKANKAKNDAISTAAADATSKVNKINIGSVNLLAGTGTPYSCNINTTSGFETRDPYFTPDKQTLSQLGFKVGDQITLSFNWTISKNGSNNFVYGDFRTEWLGYSSSGNLEYKGVIKNPVATFSASNTKGRSETTVTLNETNLLAVGLRIRVDNSVLTLNLSNVKMEKGNKATSWSPAPEDIESDITAIESETKSIKQTVSSLVVGTDSINASVKSLEESMVNTTNGLASDISKVQEQVNLAMTSDDVKLEIQKEMSKGASKVSTSTGFTFDQNGLNISKTDSEMKTQITEDGMKIYKNSEVMLTANNQGVDAKNLHATTYLIIGNNSRMEDFTEDGNKRTAVFWIG